MLSNVALSCLKKPFVSLITEAAVQPWSRDWKLLTKPVGKPVAEAAASHSISSCTESTTTSKWQALNKSIHKN